MIDSQPYVPEQLISKKALVSAMAAGALLIVAAVYFIGVPAYQINSYKNDARAKHQQVNDKMLRVYDSFKRGAFTNADSTPENDKLDVQVSRDAIKDAESIISANAPAMTKFSAWPLLGWNKSYKQATDTDTAEEKYIKQSRAFVVDYKTLLDYTEKTDDIGIKINADLKDLDKLGDQSSPADMAAAIDADVAKIKPLVGDYKAITPPTYLKSNTEAGIQVVDRVVATLQEMSTGLRALDLAKITKASTDIQNEQTTLSDTGKNFIDILQHKSPIQSEVSSLRDLDGKIMAGYGKI